MIAIILKTVLNLRALGEGNRTDEVEFRQENVPVARFQEFARLSLRGRGRGSRSERRSPVARSNFSGRFQFTLLKNDL